MTRSTSTTSSGRWRPSGGPWCDAWCAAASGPIGWYAYVPQPGGTSRLLHLAAIEREVDAVLGELVAHAKAQGSAVLTGRGEPHLMEPLSRRFAVFGLARRPILHTNNPELAAVLATDASLLTRLDGEVFYT